MAQREIILFPEKVLRGKAKTADKVTPEVRALLEDMAETMYKAPGVGLAAPQVGVALRALVVDVTAMLQEGETSHGLLHVINPKILKQEGENRFEEGCLSLPGLLVEVERPAKVTVQFQNLEGETKTIDAEGILATALQHEMDHLDGVLIIDFLSPIKRDRYKTWLKKELKRREEEHAEGKRDFIIGEFEK